MILDYCFCLYFYWVNAFLSKPSKSSIQVFRSQNLHVRGIEYRYRTIFTQCKDLKSSIFSIFFSLRAYTITKYYRHLSKNKLTISHGTLVEWVYFETFKFTMYLGIYFMHLNSLWVAAYLPLWIDIYFIYMYIVFGSSIVTGRVPIWIFE